jgi:hypothetical protein
MAADIWTDLVSQMKERGIDFDAGLTAAEIAATEGRFGFRFPPDRDRFPLPMPNAWGLCHIHGAAGFRWGGGSR